jgi:DNA (cytosine-5)-methyltransferase 1
MLRTSILTVGENKGTPRIWIEGKFLQTAGFESGRKVKTTYGRNEIVITLHNAGDHTVSSGRKAGRYPILDYQNRDIRAVLKNSKRVEVTTAYGRIVITPAYTELKRRARKEDGTLGSVFSGGGLLDEAARQAGYQSSFAVEINPDYADIWQGNHSGHMLCGCVSQLNLKTLPQVDLLAMGVPCEPFSQKRRQQGNLRREGTGPADHELADMSFWGLLLVDQCNPSTVILENVPAYVESEIGLLCMSVLRRMGYNVEHRIISGLEYGALTTRKRAVIVAKDGPIHWPNLNPARHTLRDVLLPPNHPDCEWFHQSDPDKKWLFEHWARQSLKGNGFASQQLTPETVSVQTISKRYFAGQGDAPIVRDTRPGREGWFRWLTLGEVKAIMGLPADYDLGQAKTLAGEVLGQGVLVNVFWQIIEAVAPRDRLLSRSVA